MKNYEEPTMIGDDNFEIKYWRQDFNNLYQNPQRRRGIKQKVAIVFCFIAVLAILPMLIFGLKSIQSNSSKIVTTSQIKATPTTSPQEKKTEQKESDQEVIVINNDSYWKISKRICGTGKFYLSISDQNQGKALYKDDSVRVNCSL